MPIGAWALERACADMARVPVGVRVAVNCSPVQLESFDFASHVRRCLDHFGLSADRLEIEVTESFHQRQLADRGAVAPPQGNGGAHLA